MQVEMRDVLILAVVLYQAFVYMPQTRMEISADKNQTCETKIKACYDNAEKDLEDAIDLYCLVDSRFNSQADIEAASTVRSECLKSNAFVESAKFETCDSLYQRRLRLNCTFLNVASKDLKREKQERINSSLSKLYHTK